MRGIKEKIMKPVTLLVGVFVLCALLQLLNTYRIHNQVTKMCDEHVATLKKADELKLSVVQVQQWLTDISATRAAEGYDDGLDEAAAYADKVYALIQELRALDGAASSELDAIYSSFEAYYATGVEMAHAYIDGGPEAGNEMMEAFDGVAVDINDKVDAFVVKADESIDGIRAKIFNSVIQNVIFMLLVIAATLLLYRYVQGRIVKQVVKPLGVIEEAAAELASGSLTVQVEYDAEDEIGQLAHSLQKAMDTWKLYINDIKRCMHELESGNLAIHSEVTYQGDFVELQESIRAFIGTLNQTLREINLSASKVSSGSAQISDVAQTLSEGAGEQNTSIEQLMRYIKELVERVETEAKNAQDARELMNRLGEEATGSMKQMQHMMHAMEEITESSNQIVTIVKSIEGIASQTNLLSLNASIEAARAGEAGRGFAVVAGEVADLAGESGKAANNTTLLIERSQAAVERGSKIAEETRSALSMVENGIRQVMDTIADIAETASTQSKLFSQVNQDVTRISDVVMTVSATAEESEAASEELLGQANQLNQLVEQFKLEA